jgi:hypothetical protein
MVATHCAVCSRDLVDAQSVECGIGPTCRERHGIPDKLSDEDRAEANKLVYLIAAKQRDCDEVKDALARLEVLGCTALVAAIRKRLYGKPIVLTLREDGTLAVESPYNAAAVERMRTIRGRRWVADEKVNTFPLASFEALVALFGDCYEGVTVKGLAGASVTAGGEGITRAMLGIPEAPAAAPKPEPVTVGIKVVIDGSRFGIWTPYSNEFTNCLRLMAGRSWRSDIRANILPLAEKDRTLGCVRGIWPAAKVVEEVGTLPSDERGRARRGRHYRGAY